MELEAIEDEDLTAVAAAVRHYLDPRLRNASLAEDITQETLLRVLQVRHRLDRAATVPYAVTVAKRLVIARARSNAVASRHAHRLHTDQVVPAPDDLVLRREDEVALRKALQALPAEDRSLLLAHVVDGTDTATLAAGLGGTAGGVAAKLARARARARVDYVVASNRVALPTDGCRPVLLALSAADKRRQQATGAADHLVGCSVCADLSVQLMERRRAIGALLPLPFVARWLGGLRGLFHAHPVAAASSAVGTIAVAAAVVVATTSAPPRDTAAPPTSVRRVASSTVPPTSAQPSALDVRQLLGLSRQRLRPFVGRGVSARKVLILSVPADEGFWIGDDGTKRIWVRLTGRGESPVKVVAGRRVSFRGTVAQHDSSFAVRAGVEAGEGGAQLTAMAAHIDVAPSQVVFSQ